MGGPGSGKGGSHAYQASRRAQAFLDALDARMTDEAFRDALAARAEDIKALRDIAHNRGNMRNCRDRLRAIEVMFAYGHGRPRALAEEQAPAPTMSLQLVQVAQAVLNLPPASLEAYAQTGKLPEGCWIPGYEDRVRALEAEVQKQPKAPEKPELEK